MYFGKKNKVTKSILTILVVLSLFMVGCSKPSKVETPPWTDAQVERMETEEVNSVPFAIVRF